jgi:hypothetical protein
MRVNYLLVDYENVKPKSLELLRGKSFRVLIFLGVNDKRIPVELVRSLQWLGKDVEYIQLAKGGKNALDFHIAFKLGEFSHMDASAYFHVISKDTGYDPLIDYMRKQGILVCRSGSIQDIPFLRIASSDGSERVNGVVERLKEKGAARPRKVATLKNFMNSQAANSFDEKELDSLVAELSKAGYISIEKESVSYKLPKES